jgi:Transposase/Transposase DDE domain
MIVLGADTHKSSHTIAAVKGATGEVLSDKTIQVGARGFAALLIWARGLDGERVWALEDCRHVSGALERFLIARGERVVRVSTRLMAGTRRSSRARGKSDQIDAIAVARAVCNEKQIVIAAEVNVDSPDFGHLGPMVTAAERELRAIRVDDTPEVVLADAGYRHHEQIDEIAARGTTVLIPPDAGKRKGARPGWDGGRYAFMRRVLETDLGRALYSKRQGMIEPVFANTKFNRRIDRFLRRGRAAYRSEWRLIAATHNLLKLHTATVAA